MEGRERLDLPKVFAFIHVKPSVYQNNNRRAQSILVRHGSLRSVVLFENWREVAVAVLLNMLRRLQRDVGLAPAFTRMCRRRRHLPS